MRNKLFNNPNQTQQNNDDYQCYEEVIYPYNLKWFSEHLFLDKGQVEKERFDFNFMQYTLTFRSLEYLETYVHFLDKCEIKVRKWEFTKSLEFSYDDKWIILKVAEQSDKELVPWNIDFFVKYFNLNRDQVNGYETSLGHFALKFNDPHDAYTYYKDILSKGIYPKEPRSDGRLVFTNLNEQLLIKKAAEIIRTKPQETTNSSFQFM